MEIDGLLDAIAREGIANDPPADGDYIGNDGLLYCGKCHTRKRRYLDTPDGRKIIVTIPCKCETEEKERQKAEEKRKADFDKAMELRKGSLIDEKFASASFDTCKIIKANERQLRLCKRYAEKFDEMYKKNQGLLLWGNVGTGKSHLSACIGNYIMDHLHPVYATSFVKLLEGGNNLDTDPLIKKMAKAELVIFDDLGAERRTDYAQEVVYHLIDSRYRQRKPMIITTNLSVADMKAATEDKFTRIYDRIFECCYPVQFEGSSFRKKEAARRFYEMEKLLEG